MSRPPTLPPMSRPQNDVATPNQLSPISAMSRHHFSMSQPPLLPPMSRPQNDVATSIPTGQITTQIFQVATPKGHPTSRPQIHVATPTPLVQVATLTGHRDLAFSGPGRVHRAPALRTCCPVCHDPKSEPRPHVGIWQ